MERWCHADVNAEIVAMELVWIGARERAGHSLQQVCHTATKVAAKAACRQREWLMRPRPPILMGSVAAALARTARSPKSGQGVAPPLFTVFQRGWVLPNNQLIVEGE